MGNRSAPVLVTGHACLDITPSLDEVRGELGRLIVPGKLVKVGPATVTTGGAVLNVGIPLKLLGVPTRLAGKIGDDELGRVLLSILSRYGLENGMIVARGQDTSYSIVISPPGVDRMFLHHPGANETFVVDDMLDALDPPPALAHFGYPPIMRRLYLDGGKELVRLLSTIGQAGAVVTVDTSFPDPASEAGRLDWHEILGAALPHADAFMPSIEEALFLLDRARYDALECTSAEAFFDRLGPDGVCRVCDTILDLGAAIAVVKCGGRGLCVRTGSGEVLAPIARRLGLDLGAWKERTLYAEALDVEVTGSATGAGDCAVAGFLAAMSRGEGLETAARIACAVGAQAVSAVNTISAIRTYEETLEQLETCAYRPLAVPPAGWRHLPVAGLWAPAD